MRTQEKTPPKEEPNKPPSEDPRIRKGPVEDPRIRKGPVEEPPTRREPDPFQEPEIKDPPAPGHKPGEIIRARAKCHVS